MIRNYSQVIVLFGAIFALGFALYSQYFQGYNPCEMCIWQRWVYGAVAISAVAALVTKNKIFILLTSSFILGQVGIATFHAGIEQKWWEGFTTCSAGLNTDSIDALRAQIMGAPIVRCDEIAWKFLGLSMAAWNAVYAAALFVISTMPLFNRHSRKGGNLRSPGQARG